MRRCEPCKAVSQSNIGHGEVRVCECFWFPVHTGLERPWEPLWKFTGDRTTEATMEAKNIDPNFLLIRKLRPPMKNALQSTLRHFADENGLTDKQVAMLAGLELQDIFFAYGLRLHQEKSTGRFQLEVIQGGPDR
jgi:hypothetical protein